MTGSKELALYLDAGVHAVQSTPLVSRDGRLVGVISTHWKRPHQPSERDLRLLDILSRQAADLIERKQADEALREADRRKDEFLAVLAHELRNPLAPIRNAIQILQMTEPHAPELLWASSVIDRQMGHLTRLVDDLLDVSRITRDWLELRKEHVDLAEVVHAAIEASRPGIIERGHEFTVTHGPEPVTVDADPTRLAQVFGNLLNNAAKFSEPKGRIAMSVERQNGDVLVRVRDHGIGVSEAMVPRIFDLFGQLQPSLERDQGGLGIGLALVKRLVEMHGGSVSVSSEGIGKGSEFVVRLPVVSTVRVSPHLHDEPLSETPSALRILVVDDYQDGASSMCRLLELIGHETCMAADGLAGLEAARDFRPQVVLLDIGMPKLNGYEVARRLRAEPWGASIVLIAVTGWGQAQDRQRTAEAGFDHHLIKPVMPAELARLLASLAGRAPVSLS
jgi:signal transduction histidine kinase/CheY-like chemotaxis protein